MTLFTFIMGLVAVATIVGTGYGMIMEFQTIRNRIKDDYH